MDQGKGRVSAGENEGDRLISDSFDTNSDDENIFYDKIDVRSLLKIVEYIMERATPNGAPVEVEQAHIDVAGSMSHMSFGPIRTISQLLRKCGVGNIHSKLCSTLSHYPWDAQAALALAAFTVIYGNLWLKAQLYTTNPLAKSMAVLIHLPDILSRSNDLVPKEKNSLLQSRLHTINNLIKAMLDMIKCIVEFDDQYVNDSYFQSMDRSLIPSAVKLIMKGVAFCTNEFYSLLETRQTSQYVINWDYAMTLEHEIEHQHERLKKELRLLLEDIEKKNRIQVYQNLVRLFGTIQADNLKVLKALIYSKDDLLPLVDGSTKTRASTCIETALITSEEIILAKKQTGPKIIKVGVGVLRKKTVMLFISDLDDIAQEELLILEQVYNDTPLGKAERPYEVVWLPVIQNSTVDDTFHRLQSSMPWYSLHHPSQLNPAVIEYIKKEWHFHKKPLLVVLDPQGRVIHPNAFHMLWIWGTVADPFTMTREEELWNEENWRIELLVNRIDLSILTWIGQGKFICLYGGEDIHWIRKFTSTMQRVAQEAGIPLEMVYVGKRNPKDRVKKNINTITMEKLSHCWEELRLIWFFWVRLESMWYSKMQHNRTIKSDPIMREVLSMLTLDSSEKGWVAIGRGTGEMAKASGSKILETLTNYDGWKANIEPEGFIRALNNALTSYQSHEHCSCLVLPKTPVDIHEQLSCVECGRPMEKYILYQCCED